MLIPVGRLGRTFRGRVYVGARACACVGTRVRATRLRLFLYLYDKGRAHTGASPCSSAFQGLFCRSPSLTFACSFSCVRTFFPPITHGSVNVCHLMGQLISHFPFIKWKDLTSFPLYSGTLVSCFMFIREQVIPWYIFICLIDFCHLLPLGKRLCFVHCSIPDDYNHAWHGPGTQQILME